MIFEESGRFLPKVWLVRRIHPPFVLPWRSSCLRFLAHCQSLFGWRIPQSGRLVLVASTSGTLRTEDAASAGTGAVGPAVERLHELARPFDMETARGEWAQELREIGSGRFSHGGHRICVPLRTDDRWLGAAILADRVNGVPYSVEEMDLLECIGGQVGAGLLNLRLATEMTAARELEAFQAISAFFVHDLKNAASTLSLMLTNLPEHFDDPDFREDTLRGIGSIVKRINRLIARAGALKHGLELKPTELDLNALLTEAVAQVNGDAGPKWVKNLQPVPEFSADREQLQSVVMNLLLNAADAVGSGWSGESGDEPPGWLGSIRRGRQRLRDEPGVRARVPFPTFSHDQERRPRHRNVSVQNDH